MACWRDSKPECSARWIVCDSRIEEEARDFLDWFPSLSRDNVNIRMSEDGSLIRYAYVNDRGAGFVLEIDPGVMDPECLAPIKERLLAKLTEALYGDPRWQLLYYIIERQMLPTP